MHAVAFAKLKMLAVAVTLAIGMTAVSRDAQAQAAESRRYDIPAGNLADCVRQLGLQSNLQLLAPPELTSNLRCQRVAGTYTARQALDRVLAGSRLSYEFVNGSTVVIKQGDSSAKAQPSATTVDNEKPAGSKPLQEPTTLEAMTVTGSRLKRIGSEGASQVIQIDRTDIERSGASSVRELLNTLPQASVAPDESGNSSFLGASSVQLRGLSLGSTLILINGRRVSGSSIQAARNFFDLNSIPLEAIERVEVLTDSASAVYGGDALAGAVNFILRKNFEGMVMGTRYGTSDAGDAAEKGATWTIGGGEGRLSGLMVVDWKQRDAVTADARALTADQDFSRFGGEDMRSTRSYPANVYALAGQGNLPGLNHPFASTPAGSNGIGLTPSDFVATDGNIAMFDRSEFVTMIPESERTGLMATGRFDINPNFSLFGELMYTRNIQKVLYSPAGLGRYLVPAENPFNPFGVDVEVDYTFAELGARMDDSTNTFLRVVSGAEGLVGDTEWRVAAMYDRDTTRSINRNWLDYDALDFYLASTNPADALNVFSSTGNNNPGTLAALRTEPVDRTGGDSMMLEATLSGGWTLPGGYELSYAAGVNHRNERLRWMFSYDDPTDNDRKINAAYAEFLLPLGTGERRLELNAAGRYDRYSDFGSSFNPQFGALWRPAPWLLLRASAGTAFKAPSLYDVNAPVWVEADTVVSDPLRNGELAEIAFSYGGNPKIRPEEAESLSFGFIIEPERFDGLSMGMTFFRIRQEDFIVRINDPDLMLANPEIFAGRIVRAAPTQSDIQAGLPGRLLALDATAVNYGEIVVRGVDVQASYQFPRASTGEFKVSLDASYIDSFEVALMPGDALRNEVGYANGAGYPTKLKGNLGLQWQGNGGFGAGVTGRYLHNYVDYDGVRRMPSQWWFDAQLRYEFGQALSGLQLTLGGINLNNNQGRFSNNSAGYDYQQADLRGRFYYLNLKYAF